MADYNSYRDAGKVFYEQGRYDEARAEFDKALALKPEDAGIHNQLGLVAWWQKKYEIAEKEFNRGGELLPLEPVFAFNLGLALTKQKRYADAEAAYRRALELRADNLNARKGLGSVLFEQGRYDEARAEFDKVLALKPEDAEVHNWLGGVALARNQYETAEKEFKNAIEFDKNKEVPEARLKLGAMLTLLERLDEAKDFLVEAAKVDPGNDECFNELGRLYFKEKAFDKALSQYQIAIGKNPQNLRAQRGLALCLMELEHFGDAEKRLQNLVKSKKLGSRDFLVFQQTLVDLYIRWGNACGDERYYEEAIDVLDKAFVNLPQNDKSVEARLLFSRGVINCHRKQYETAAKDFSKCVARFGDCVRRDDSFFDSTYFVARRNLERLQGTFSMAGGLEPKTLKRVVKYLTCLAIVQLAVIWVLYLTRWADISTKMFAVLVPLFFGMILLSLLLPQLNKFKIGGITAEISSKSEHLEGVKELQIEKEVSSLPVSIIAPDTVVSDVGQGGSGKLDSK